MSDATTIAIEGPTSPNTIVVVDSGEVVNVILYAEQGTSGGGGSGNTYFPGGW